MSEFCEEKKERLCYLAGLFFVFPHSFAATVFVNLPLRNFNSPTPEPCKAPVSSAFIQAWPSLFTC